PDIIVKYHTKYLGLTLPFPLYGIFRYLYLVHQKEGGGSPSEMLLNDKPLLACVALWAAGVGLTIYGSIESRDPANRTGNGAAGLSHPDEPGRLPGRGEEGCGYRAQGQ